MTDLGLAADLSATTERHLECIGQADEYGAIDLLLGLLDEGVPAERLLLEVVAPAQRRVGDLWAANEWSVAREHGATAVSERAVAAVAAKVRTSPKDGRVTVACSDGEYHQLPTRLLAEVLRLRGWQVDFLGASVPGFHLVTHLHQTGPDAVALGCALPTRLPRAHATITACQAVGVPVLAGGLGFGAGGRFARKLGADGWAPTADAAADLLQAGLLPSFPAPLETLPHLADARYAQLVKGRAGQLSRTMRALTAAYPPMASYSDQQLESTADDLGHIVDFLAAALYVDDVPLFTDFISWTCEVLRVRGVPSASVVLGLCLLRDELHDLPRARDILAEGIETARSAQ
ncbi:cobalamin B12-binding domain-containing protein [Sphaerisporangium perillae]|uniref:cobalamin B12-binding domain-containing protein n=1 Tax=Sphaerisporangium perillae TaxID=2935860 RepID=UPI00200E3D5A|nr:cobalamin-dependent protein [Sphaerisporangium perillae]